MPARRLSVTVIAPITCIILSPARAGAAATPEPNAGQSRRRSTPAALNNLTREIRDSYAIHAWIRATQLYDQARFVERLERMTVLLPSSYFFKTTLQLSPLAM
jgi:hypothetical protein